MTYLAVIPAAGRGTRLGEDRPKILVELLPDTPIWRVLSQTMAPFVDSFAVILSPEGKTAFRQQLDRQTPPKPVDLYVQPEPRGMGDAIFQAAEAIGRADHILVIWGDQVHVSPETLRRVFQAHDATKAKQITLPLVRLAQPYVEYCFGQDGKLTHILQSREGDVCTPNGWGDVGTFVLSTQGLHEAWQAYLATQATGAQTGEINFLPFLTFLSQKDDWVINRVEIDDPNEARGINTQEDLAFFRKFYAQQNRD